MNEQKLISILEDVESDMVCVQSAKKFIMRLSKEEPVVPLKDDIKTIDIAGYKIAYVYTYNTADIEPDIVDKEYILQLLNDGCVEGELHTSIKDCNE